MSRSALPLALASLSSLAAVHAPRVAHADEVADVGPRAAIRGRELILRLRPGLRSRDLRALERAAGVVFVEESGAIGAFRVEVRQGRSLSAAWARLAGDPRVADVAPNAIARAADLDSPDDPLFKLQWNLA